MKLLRSILNHAGTGPLQQAFANYLKAYERNPSARAPALEALVTQLATRDLRLLAKLAMNPRLLKAEGDAMARIVAAAYRLTTTDRNREFVRLLAAQAGFMHDLESDPPPAGINYLTASQAEAYAQLKGLAQIFFSQQNHEKSPVSLRLNPLIVGPSGVGKNHLVSLLGEELKIPVLRFTVGDWIVLGSRMGQTSFEVIQRSLDQHERLIIYFDELDKYRAQDNSWTLSQTTEIFSVLDRAVSHGGSSSNPWTGVHSRKLRDNVFLIGAGTWQDVWKHQIGRRMGFGNTETQHDEIAHQIRRSGLIPEELLNRFLDRWLVLTPYTEDDFRRVAQALDLGPDILDPVEAAASGRNFRYVENALTADALRRQLREAGQDP